MNRTDQNPEAILDAAIAAVREREPEADEAKAAASRVWSRLQAAAEMPMRAERLETCEDFRALFAEYRAGTLPGAQRLLVQDHVHDCLPCRKVLHPITVRLTESKAPEAAVQRWRPARWAVAASILAVTSMVGFYAWDFIAPPPSGSRITVVSANGPVYRVKNGVLSSAGVGAQFSDGERIRTAGGAHAVVKLLDGSTVELGERAEFAVNTTRRNTDLRLERGQIIVQATKRSRGHLFVTSADARVAVTGTVFAVNRGLKGSRVSVIEGAVEVQYRGNENLLRPGDQLVTDRTLSKVPINEEIAWSRNSDQHLALMRQFVDLKQKLDQVKIATLRYNPRLLDSVPANAVTYISLPNLGRALTDVQAIVRQQAAQSPEFRQMLGHSFPEIERTAAALAKVGDYLGDDIVIALQPCRECVVLMAEVQRPGLREHIEKEFGPMLKETTIRFANGRIFAGRSAAMVDAASRGGSRFPQTPFGQKVADVYKRGAGILVAADLGESLNSATKSGSFPMLGIDGVKYLIAEQREINGRNEYSAVVNFAGTRQGIASWLAEPGAMGSLGFVSQNAQFAASFVVKEPALMLRDLVQMTDRFSRAQFNLDALERDTGVRVADLAEALGGEITLAVDGPLVPVPSWKLITEVKDAARLQSSIERLIQAANSRLTQTKIEAGSRMTQGRDPRRMYFVRLPGTLFSEVHYTFVDGYGVFAPAEALVERAISDRRAGVSLARSGDFRRLLPGGGQTNLSGMVYQNAGDLIRMMTQGAASTMTAEQSRTAEEIAAKVEPMLVALYGERDRIQIASLTGAFDLLTQAMAGRLLAPPDKSNRTRKELHAY